MGLTAIVRLVAGLKAENAALKEEHTVLKEENERLRRLLEQNSTNSHLPPSSDGPGGRSHRRKGTKPKGPPKKRGPKQGHQGSHRVALGPDRVTDTIHSFPEQCRDCGADLKQVPDPNAAVFEHVDIDKRAGVVVKHWHRHCVRCEACGAKTRPTLQEAGAPRFIYGQKLMALVCYMTGFMHVPRRGVRQFVMDFYDLKISLGTISAMEARVATALKPAQDELLQHTKDAPMKHTDASTWVTAGESRSITTIATECATVYFILPDGSRDAMRHLFGESLNGILVSDRASVYRFWRMNARQICWEHLRRKSVAFSERDGPAGRIGKDFHKICILVFEYWNAWRENRITRRQFRRIMPKLRKSMRTQIQRGITSGVGDIPGVCRNLRDHEEAMWTFVEHESVPPSNNHAERELRSVVTWRKVCFGSQSERGERFAERIMSVARTARKLGVDMLAYMRDALSAYHEGEACPMLLSYSDQS